jgi:hypothetical protein
MAQCRALRRDGIQCNNEAKFGGFCGVHFPKGKKPSLVGATWKTVEVAGSLAGAVEFIKLIIEIWRNLPFGPGPQMPRDYHELARKFRPQIATKSRDEVYVFNKGADSVDWRKAKWIYDAANSTLTQMESGACEETFMGKAAQIDSELNSLLETMPGPLRKIVCEDIGELEVHERN